MQDKGTVTLDGLPIGQVDLESANIGYCPETDALFEFMTVEEHIDFFGMHKNIPFTTQQLLTIFHLESFNNSQVRYLNKSNKRLLSFCLSHMFFPKIILLDELTSEIEGETSKLIFSLSEDLAHISDYASISSFNRSTLAEEVADTVGLLRNGQMRLVGLPHMLKKSNDVDFIIKIGFALRYEESTEEELILKSKEYNHFINVEKYLKQSRDEQHYLTNLRLLLEISEQIMGLTESISF